MKLDIPAFEKARILVVGDLMLDRYWHGNTARISPEAPVPVVGIKREEVRAGGAANVALNASALGAKVTAIGIIGKDQAGKNLSELLQKANINFCPLLSKKTPTVTKLRIISQHQQLIRLDFEDGFPAEEAAELLKIYQNELKKVDLVVLSDYAKGTLQQCKQMISLAKDLKKPILVDPKSKDFNIYRDANLITPNLGEFEQVMGKVKDEEDLVEKAQALLRKTNIEAILITRGAEGMSFVTLGQPPLHIPTKASEVFDVAGAGDTVIATVAASLAAGEPLPNALSLANIAAGISIRKLGVATVSETELRKELLLENNPNAAILDLDNLLKEISFCQKAGEKIVMTNGCFDLLHPGHVSYLEKAKELGDRLIIAVNDDQSVKKLKGPERPINSLDKRMLVLSALRSIDWVIPFSEETPEKLIKKIKPDVLVKGGDYKIEEIAGAKFVQSYGGMVKIIPFQQGHSTSKVIEKIKGEK
jgi:D-beta-D-heptose 7-phosphate kinase / D-beta-D-heptose 1-phosphate adenosyltransferase